MDNKSFLKKFLFLLLCIIILDFTFGKILSHFYFCQKKGKLHNITYALQDQESQILILGSSRAMHHYNPDIISERLGKSCYNAGMDGQSILYHKAVSDVIFNRYTPETILLDINLLDFEFFNQDIYDMLSCLNPYAAQNPVLWESLNLISKHESLKHLSHIYPYNSLIARIVMGNLNIETKDESENGFTAKEGIWKENKKEDFFETAGKKLNPDLTHAFQSIVEKCKANGTELIVIISPLYVSILNNSISMEYIQKYCSDNNIPIINYVNNPVFEICDYYYDPTHLNTKGANVFTEDLTQKISLYINHN